MTIELTRRQLMRSVLCLAGAMVFGCDDRRSSGSRVTLTQWYHQYGEHGTQDAVLRYAQEYTRLHPDVAVQVQWIPGDYGTKLSTALLTSGGPDVFEGQVSQAMVGAGQIAALDDLLSPGLRADFAQKDLDLNSVNGKLYGIKMLDDTGVLYYRKSAFAAAGLQPPTTMDELIAAVRKLTTSDRKGIFLGNDGGLSALANIAPWSAGTDFLVDNRIVFNNPRTVAAYEKLKELGDSDAVLLGAPTDWWDPAAFVQGLSAVQWSGLWAYPAIRKALGDDAGAMAWPALDAAGVPATFLGGWTSMVNAQSDHMEEAKKYVKWLWVDSVANQLDWNLSYGFHVPPRKSLALEASALQEPVPAIAVKNLRDYGKTVPPIWNSAMGSALTDALTNSLKLGNPIEDELNTAAEKCNRELQRALEG